MIKLSREKRAVFTYKSKFHANWFHYLLMHSSKKDDDGSPTPSRDDYSRYANTIENWHVLTIEEPETKRGHNEISRQKYCPKSQTRNFSNFNSNPVILLGNLILHLFCVYTILKFFCLKKLYAKNYDFAKKKFNRIFNFNSWYRVFEYFCMKFRWDIL